jgi:hypothetical protein
VEIAEAHVRPRLLQRAVHHKTGLAAQEIRHRR